MNMFQSFASFMQEGGVWMYPILLTLVCGIAISIELGVKRSQARFFNLTMQGSFVVQHRDSGNIALEALVSNSFLDDN